RRVRELGHGLARSVGHARSLMAAPFQWPIVAGLAAAAVGWDLATRRVPNVLTFGAAGLAFAVSAAQAGLGGLAWSVLGWLAGVGLFLPLFAIGGLGAGDVKLLAAFGACLGPRGAFFAAIWAALTGGVLAVIVAASKGYLGRALGNLKVMAA